GVLRGRGRRVSGFRWLRFHGPRFQGPGRRSRIRPHTPTNGQVSLYCSPATEGIAGRPAAVCATGDPLGQLSTRDRSPAHVVGAEHDTFGQVTVHVDR